MYDYLFAWSQEQGFDTYDLLPVNDSKVPYPFVVIGDTQLVPGGTKTSLNGNVLVGVAIWGTRKQRFTINDMAERFFHAVLGPIETEHYRLNGLAADQSKQFTFDTSVANTVFSRATLDLNLRIL